MNSLRQYIMEKFQVCNDYKRQYIYQPKTKDELIKVIQDKIDKEGYGTKDKPLNLNDIDTSKITDMAHLFDRFDGKLRRLSLNGYFDISDWDVSNVEDMNRMFCFSQFKGDISDWDVSNVTNMRYMFYGSTFDGDISEWNVNNVEEMNFMFSGSAFSGKNGDISDWNINDKLNMINMFSDCHLEKNPPKWYKNESN